MSLIHPTSAVNQASLSADAATRTRAAPDSQWFREPLLHFFLLGVLLFAMDHFILGRADDPRTILVDAAVDDQARQVFKEARGLEPNEDELYALRKVWLDNEVLYREGLALQVDKGDAAIRERVIFKALSVVDSGLKLPPVSDKVLRDWFESNRAKYDEPARYDFEEAVLPGETSEAVLREFAASLNSGVAGEARGNLRVFKGRPHSNLVQSYGPDFVKAIESSPVGEWRVLPSRDSLRVMRLISITPPKPAVFESLGGVVLHDWTDAIMAEQRTAAVRALAKKYNVRVEAATQ
jgi:PPIC-type PPIASE domain